MVRNPSYHEPNLLSADELFVDGVLLPLHLLSHQHRDPRPEPESHLPYPEPHPPPPPPPDPEPEPGPGPKITASSVAAESNAPLSASKRWRDIFKKGDKKNTKTEQADNNNNNNKDKEKEKKKERKSVTGTSSVAELNINIWPFSRSRSAGNACTRPKTMFGAPSSRKVNSAPCSRSNSAGESKSRKWPSSPGRAGVHLGRSSPVWQVRRGGSRSGSLLGRRSVEPLVRNVEKGSKKEAPESRRSKPASAVAAAVGGGGAAKTKVLNINVPTCIGYRNHLSCRNDENGALSVGNNGGADAGKIRSSGAGASAGGGGRSGGGGVSSVGSGGNLFNLRSLFTKKVY